MKQLVLMLGIAALVLPASALGKGGPSGASIDPPGGKGPTAIAGSALNVGTNLGDLTWYGGYYPAVFGGEPGAMLASRPKGDLGPKYTITYTVPRSATESDKILHDIYPYAKPGPVTYMEPGQKVFENETRGGWYRADPRVMRPLVAVGFPENAPPSPPAPASPPEGSSFPVDLVALLAAAAALLLAATVVVRRRIRPTQTA